MCPSNEGSGSGSATSRVHRSRVPLSRRLTDRTGPGRPAASPTAKTRRGNSASQRRSAAVVAHRPRATAMGGQNLDPGRSILRRRRGAVLAGFAVGCLLQARLRLERTVDADTPWSVPGTGRDVLSSAQDVLARRRPDSVSFLIIAVFSRTRHLHWRAQASQDCKDAPAVGRPSLTVAAGGGHSARDVRRRRCSTRCGRGLAGGGRSWPRGSLLRRGG
jgi:hypothetical protein